MAIAEQRPVPSTDPRAAREPDEEDVAVLDAYSAASAYSVGAANASTIATVWPRPLTPLFTVPAMPYAERSWPGWYPQGA